MKTFNHILVCGDIHGEIDVIPNFIKTNNLNNCAIIVAGDFGIGFESMYKEIKRISYLSKRLKNSNSIVYAVRGNHDNPVYFTGQYDTDYVKLVSDYTVLNLNNINILCVGGAYSVDRKNRKSYYKPKQPGKDNIIPINDYWSDEIIIYDEDKINTLRDINVVITHTAPQIAPPYTKGGLEYWIRIDDNIVEDCKNERLLLNLIYENLIKNDNKIDFWFYGHFHENNNIIVDDTNFIGLSINEFSEIIKK